MNNKGANFVSVLIPSYNEALSLRELYERTRATLDKLGLPFEFIVVDDGSTDETTEIIKDLQGNGGNVLYIRHRINHGKSLALMQGFHEAEGDVLITMDADLQDNPEDISLLLEELDKGYHLVNGWRKSRKDTSVKRFVSRIYNWLTNKILQCPLHDINCGFKVMRKELYKSLELRGDLHRLVPALACGLGYKISEVPVQHTDRRYGVSRYKLLRHRGILDIIIVAASQSTQTRPFHVFFETAFFALIGVIVSFILWLIFMGNGSEVGQFIFGALTIWGLFLATLLPLFGFSLEAILMTQKTDSNWHKRLVMEIIRPDKIKPKIKEAS